MDCCSIFFQVQHYICFFDKKYQNFTQIRTEMKDLWIYGMYVCLTIAFCDCVHGKGRAKQGGLSKKSYFPDCMSEPRSRHPIWCHTAILEIKIIMKFKKEEFKTPDHSKIYQLKPRIRLTRLYVYYNNHCLVYVHPIIKYSLSLNDDRVHIDWTMIRVSI